MSKIDMTQVAGIQAVNAEGKVIGTLSVDDLTELVATKIVQEAKNEAVSARSASVMSEASTLAATDEYEDQLELDTNPAYVRSLDSEGNPKRTATTSLATVVGELIGTATTNQDGLMPAFRSMTIHYNDADNVVKYTLPSNIGFSMCITVIKNHESGGQAVVFVTGYQGGIVADAVRKGYYLKGISYVTNSDSIDIYVKVNSFVFVTAKCMGASDKKFIKSASLVSEIPEGAKEVQL